MFRFRRTLFKTLREEVQESEVAHEDPAKVIIKATRKRSVVQQIAVVSYQNCLVFHCLLYLTAFYVCGIMKMNNC